MNDKIQTFIQATGIQYAPVGVYDLPEPEQLTPFTPPSDCVFADFEAWQSGKSTMIGNDNAAEFGCPGSGHWLCGISAMPVETVAGYLAGEGLKASTEIMCDWLKKHPPYKMENKAVVITRLRETHYEYLKTVTFFVTADQLSLLVTGAEYRNENAGRGNVEAPYGSGCGLLLALFTEMDKPRAMIGATDIAMRKHLPENIMAFTVTRPMLGQLLDLDENSFLHKTFWRELKETRQAG